MRTRAARLSLALALTAALAVIGVAGPHAGAQFLRPVIGTAAAPAHAAVAGLPGLHGHRAYLRVAAVDVLLAPATLLTLLFAGVVSARRFRPPLGRVTPAVAARGPPTLR